MTQKTTIDRICQQVANKDKRNFQLLRMKPSTVDDALKNMQESKNTPYSQSLPTKKVYVAGTMLAMLLTFSLAPNMKKGLEHLSKQTSALWNITDAYKELNIHKTWCENKPVYGITQQQACNLYVKDQEEITRLNQILGR